MMTAAKGKGIDPLHQAAAGDNALWAKELLDTGTNVNVRDKANLTPLHWAAKFGSLETARLLLKRGADIHAKGGIADTPLRLLMSDKSRREEIRRLLRAHGASE